MPTGRPSRSRSAPRSSASADRARARALIRWFRARARDLPWRETDPALGRRDAYRSLVSEFMLQQTQVARVLEKFTPFVERFPDAPSLARAPERDVLAMWSGLGYYRRAKMLHRAARQIVERHGGEVPADVAALRELAGVGAYTAGAIASIVFGAREPLADGNVARVLLRIDGKERMPGAAPATMKWVWARAAELLRTPDAAHEPGVLNEALMELGATVCTPRAPRCAQCPLRESCTARAKGLQEEIPPPKAKPARKPILAVSVVVRNARAEFLLEQRPARGMWAGMWQAPTLERACDPSAKAEKELAAELREDLGLASAPVRIDRFEHTTTHRDVVFAVYGCDGEPARRGESRVWVASERLEEYGLSNAQRRVLGRSGEGAK